MHSSFDVFDTVLTRTVGAPDAMLAVLGRSLQESGTLPVEPATFVRVRLEAAARVALVKGREPRLREIYDEVVAALGLPSACALAAFQAELDCERRLSRPVPGAQMRLAAARRTGPVLFVSDTPLPGCVVEELLRQADLWAVGDRLFVSSDHGVTKAGGGLLFNVAARQLGIRVGDIHHTGDSAMSDVGEARLRGLSATAEPAARLNRFEQLLESEAVASAGLSSYLAGASRLARLQAGLDGVDPAVASVAAGVAAPLLIGYCSWLVDQARAQGLRRLYFLARDGEVMLDIFRHVAVIRGAEDIDARYLYGSRAAWASTSLAAATSEDIRQRLFETPGDTVSNAVFRLGLAIDDARALLPHAELLNRGDDEPLSDADLARLADLLGQQPVLERVHVAAARRRGAVIDFLRQEGLHEDGQHAALVDVGWTGRTCESLDALMRGAGWAELRSFFFIGRTSAAAVMSPPRVAARQHAFLFDQLSGQGRALPVNGMDSLIEALCTGTEGSVLGYEHRDGTVRPVLVTERNGPALEWGLRQFRHVLDLAVTELLAADVPLGRVGDLGGAVDQVLRELWCRPTPAEVAVWGSFPMDTTEEHIAMRGLAVPVRTAEVAAQLRAGHWKVRPAVSWRAGTAALSSAPWRQLLRSKAWYEAHGARLKRIPRRLRLEVATRRAR